MASLSEAELNKRVEETLGEVNMEAHRDKPVRVLSGGQKKRVSIAIELLMRPQFIILDEPTSALDRTVQKQVISLLRELQQKYQLSYIFISHDLAVVDYVCDEVAVMYLGRIVEQAPTGRLFDAPAHPYTQALIDSVPRIGAGRRRDRTRLRGGVSVQMAEFSGCPFSDRCPRVESRCRDEAPALREIDNGHMASCHFA